MLRGLTFCRRTLLSLLLVVMVASALALFAGSAGSPIYARAVERTASTSQAAQTACTTSPCKFQLQVNPGLLSGAFACPAIQGAKAHITITNRFATGALNDVMTLTASGLPPHTGFDMFLVQNSPLDPGTFSSFGFGWYQSDVESSSTGTASVKVQGIFDKETFIENPSNPFTPINTFNVGFWFDSPTVEQQVCKNANPPAKTPFNGEQDAGLLAMITQGEPLGLVR